jgi:hypothetical protein
MANSPPRHPAKEAPTEAGEIPLSAAVVTPGFMRELAMLGAWARYAEDEALVLAIALLELGLIASSRPAAAGKGPDGDAS